jgi:hypothetical protein
MLSQIYTTGVNFGMFAVTATAAIAFSVYFVSLIYYFAQGYDIGTREKESFDPRKNQSPDILVAVIILTPLGFFATFLWPSIVFPGIPIGIAYLFRRRNKKFNKKFLVMQQVLSGKKT